MSAWGFGGFANGFLQGFNTMGQEFARRGLLRRERETSARDERRLALEEEIQRGNAQRADEEAALLNEQRQMNNDILRVQVPHAADAAQRTNRLGELAVEDAEFNAQHREDKYKAAMDEATASINHTKAGTALTEAQTQEVGPNARSARDAQGATTAYTQAQTQGVNANTKKQQLKNAEAEQKQQTQRRLADSFQHFVNGDANDEHMRDVELVLPLAGTRVSEINKILDQAREKVRQTGGEYRPDTDPQVMTALNDVFGGFIGRTRGMPVNLPGAPDQQYTVGNTRLIGFERNPQNPKQMGPVFEVEAVATPQLQDEIKQMIDSGRDGTGEPLTPEQKQGLETLTRRTYRAPLTQGRVPFNQGGERVWFNPEDFEEMRKDLSKVETWQKKHPEFAAQLAEYRAQLARDGVLSPPKPIDPEKAFKQKLDARKDARETLELQQKSRDAIVKRIDDMIAKHWGAETIENVFQLGGADAERAYAERKEASRVLRQNPAFDEDQIMNEVEKTLGPYKKGAATGTGAKTQPLSGKEEKRFTKIFLPD